MPSVSHEQRRADTEPLKEEALLIRAYEFSIHRTNMCYVCLVSDVSICVWNSQLHMLSLLHSHYGQFGLESAQARPHLEPIFTVGASPGGWAYPSATPVLRMSVVEEPVWPFPGDSASGTRYTAYFSRHLLICVPTVLTQMLFRRLCVPEVRP